MKHFLSILWKITGTLIILIGLGFFIARVINVAPSNKLSVQEQVVTIVEEGGCFVCHGGPDFYPNINVPVFGHMIEKKAEKGVRYANAFSVLMHLNNDEAVDESIPIKMQKVISERSMPPLSYSIIHWKSAIIKDKQKILLHWLYDHLSTEHDWPVPTKERTFEPIIPVPDSLPANLSKVNLGRILFNDPRLSADSTVSCATCHKLDQGGADNMNFSLGAFAQPGRYSTTTIFNAAFQQFFFWDGRVSSLALQSALMLTDPVIMGNESFEEITDRLEADPDFTSLFTATYTEGFSAENITDALAEYHKVLITPDAPFDQFLKGDGEAISPDAKKGYDLFKKIGCASCHNGVAIGGNSLEYMGLSNKFFPSRDKVQLPDLGRYRVTGLQEDIYKFKVPGLRNVALTYPYFHNSSAPDLETAVKTMAFYQRDKTLTLKEIREVVSFLRTLTGTFEGKLLTGSIGE